jgi:hypothetical protein
MIIALLFIIVCILAVMSHRQREASLRREGFERRGLFIMRRKK